MQINGQMLQSLLSGLIASILTFILGVVYTTSQREKDYKIKYRASLKSEELYNCKYDLSGSQIESGKKIINTENYRKIETYFKKNETDKETKRINFFKLKNIGPGIIINLTCTLEYKYTCSKGNLLSKVEFNLETFEVGEEIYMCPENLDIRLFNDDLSVSQYTLNFKFETMAGETINQVKRYYSENDEQLIENKILYKNIFGRWKILYSSNIKPVLWNFTKKS